MRALYAVAVLLFAFAARADALSIDASALSSGENRQVQGQVAHIAEYERSTFESGAKYAKVRGRDQTYELWVAQTTKWACGFRVQSDTRRYQSHDSFSSALGFGWSAFILAAGARVDYKDGRDTFGKLALSAQRGTGVLKLSARAEALQSTDNFRLDYQGQARFQLGLITQRLYVAARVEEVRSVKSAGISLGVSLF
jgi:hypothetical protein